MKISSQNLTETGLKWLHGRAWLRRKNDYPTEKVGMEWAFGKHGRTCGVSIHLHHGENDDGVMFHIGIPWLFAIYVYVEGVMKRGKESEVGFAIHHGALWLYTGTYVMDYSKSDPWYRQSHSWAFPWTLEHHKTEVLDAHGRFPVDKPSSIPVLFEDVSQKRGNGKRFMDTFEARCAAQAQGSKVFPYTYRRKNGQVQARLATVYVERMTHRARWWPFIPRKQVVTSIWANFNEEIGEGVGSWKGGVTGCGYTMLKCETPKDTLKRMERERKFDR